MQDAQQNCMACLMVQVCFFHFPSCLSPLTLPNTAKWGSPGNTPFFLCLHTLFPLPINLTCPQCSAK